MKIAGSSLLVVSAVTVAMLAAVACGKPASAEVGNTSTRAATLVRASCNSASVTGTCTEWQRGEGFRLEKQLCDGDRGQFAMGGCAEQGQIGRCLLPDGESKRYYGTGPHAFSRARAQADCEDGALGGRLE